MTTFNTVLVAGATGNLGYKTSLALLESKKFKEVRVLVRAATLKGDNKKEKLDELKKKGAVFAEGDLKDISSLKEALKGVDVVLSTVTGDTFVQGQLNLIEASKAAGVKRFFPAEFGGEHNLEDEGSVPLPYQWKQSVSDAVAKSGLEWTLIHNGVFLEYFFSPFIGFDLKAGTVNIFGDGKQKMAATDVNDIAKALPYIILNPSSKNAKVKIVGDRLSQLEGIALYEKITGKTLTRTSTSVQSMKDEIAAKGKTFATLRQQLVVYMAAGGGDIQVNNNKEYPQVHFATAEEYLKRTTASQ